MKITQVKIHLVSPGEPIAKLDSRILATAAIQLDDKLYLNDIKICRTPERICIEFVKNPYACDSGRSEYSVVPVSMKARHWIEGIILTEYMRKIREKRKYFVKRGFYELPSKQPDN
ncbi:MAG TPA: septation protein SpoVG family protein [Caproicibacter sp.]|nr:septation protein SpoVG family protein [Caproicibacter sp.]